MLDFCVVLRGHDMIIDNGSHHLQAQIQSHTFGFPHFRGNIAMKTCNYLSTKS